MLCRFPLLFCVGLQPTSPNPARCLCIPRYPDTPLRTSATTIPTASQLFSIRLGNQGNPPRLPNERHAHCGRPLENGAGHLDYVISTLYIGVCLSIWVRMPFTIHRGSKYMICAPGALYYGFLRRHCSLTPESESSR